MRTAGATTRRRRALRAIVAHQAAHTQEELVEALQREGFPASQASVSRDIAALGLIKVDGRYALPIAPLPGSDPFEERVRGRVLAIRGAGPSLLVLETPPGDASAVALALDRIAIQGVAGTIAGDDTIFVAIGDDGDAASVTRKVREVSGLNASPAPPR